MFRSRRAEEPLDDALEAALIDRTSEAVSLLQRIQPKLRDALRGEVPSLIASGKKEGIAITPSALLLLSKDGATRLGREHVTKIDAHDDQFQARTVVVWFDMTVIGGRPGEVGAHTVSLVTPQGFGRTQQALAGWMG